MGEFVMPRSFTFEQTTDRGWLAIVRGAGRLELSDIGPQNFLQKKHELHGTQH